MAAQGPVLMWRWVQEGFHDGKDPVKKDDKRKKVIGAESFLELVDLPIYPAEESNHVDGVIHKVVNGGSIYTENIPGINDTRNKFWDSQQFPKHRDMFNSKKGFGVSD